MKFLYFLASLPALVLLAMWGCFGLLHTNVISYEMVGPILYPLLQFVPLSIFTIFYLLTITALRLHSHTKLGLFLTVMFMYFIAGFTFILTIYYTEDKGMVGLQFNDLDTWRIVCFGLAQIILLYTSSHMMRSTKATYQNSGSSVVIRYVLSIAAFILGWILLFSVPAIYREFLELITMMKF